MFNILRKTLAVCLIGFGLGILLVILLPLSRLVIFIRCCGNSCWANVASMLNDYVCLLINRGKIEIYYGRKWEYAGCREKSA